MLPLCPGPCHLSDLYHHGWDRHFKPSTNITQTIIHLNFRAKCKTRGAQNWVWRGGWSGQSCHKCRRQKKKSSRWISEEPGITVSLLSKQTESSREGIWLEQTEPCQGASALCRDDHAGKASHKTEHLMMIMTRWGAPSASPPWCLSLCSGTGRCPCLTAGPRSSTGSSSSAFGEYVTCNIWHVTCYTYVMMFLHQCALVHSPGDGGLVVDQQEGHRPSHQAGGGGWGWYRGPGWPGLHQLDLSVWELVNRIGKLCLIYVTHWESYKAINKRTEFTFWVVTRQRTAEADSQILSHRLKSESVTTLVLRAD